MSIREIHLLAIALFATGCLQTELVGVVANSGDNGDVDSGDMGGDTGLATLYCYPTDDAYLEYDAPPSDGCSLRNNETLKVRAPPPNPVRISYLRFDLSDLSDEVVSARLSLKEKPGQPRAGTWDVYLGEHANWTESTLSVTDPPRMVTLLDTLTGGFAAHDTYEWDVSLADLGGGTHTLILGMEEDAGDDPSFWSKDGEGEAGWRAPVLILETRR